MKKLILLFSFFWITYSFASECPSKLVSPKVWNLVQPYLMKEDHPIKPTLDAIVSKSSVFYDLHSMTKGGFDSAIPQHYTRIIVTRHPQLKGYVIKAYLDVQKYHNEKPEYYYWIKRVQGSRLIQSTIKKNHYEHLIKVPKKWIYLLPDHPPRSLKGKRKMFILVEEDMDILSDSVSKKMWGSEVVTEELLKALHTIIVKHKFSDCAKPANCPFSRDGRVALVDTQSFNREHYGLFKLNPYLSPKMKLFWKSLQSN